MNPGRRARGWLKAARAGVPGLSDSLLPISGRTQVNRRRSPLSVRDPEGTGGRSPPPGPVQRSNLLGAIGAAMALGLPPGGRERRIQLRGSASLAHGAGGRRASLSVIVDYAHTDDAPRNFARHASPAQPAADHHGIRLRGRPRPVQGPLMGLVRPAIRPGIATSDNPERVAFGHP